jgi:hypothetical protein
MDMRTAVAEAREVPNGGLKLPTQLTHTVQLKVEKQCSKSLTGKQLIFSLLFLAAPKLKRLVAGFPPRRPGSGHVGFVVDKVVLGQVFSEYFDFPCQSSSHQLLHNHPHLSSGACTIGQK